MCEHGIDTDIGEAEDVIVKSDKIDAINSGKDLFFDLFLDSCGSGKFLDSGVIEACSFGMGSSIGASCMLGCRAQVCREEEIDSSNSCIFSIRHDKPQMAMDTATMGGRDGMCIGVNLFGERFNGGVGRCSDDLSEC